MDLLFILKVYLGVENAKYIIFKCSQKSSNLNIKSIFLIIKSILLPQINNQKMITDDFTHGIEMFSSNKAKLDVAEIFLKNLKLKNNILLSKSIIFL